MNKIEIILGNISSLLICFYILTFFIKKLLNISTKSNILCCGLFGFSLKEDANLEAAMVKLKILGIYNLVRGRDSCGVYVNNELIKGTGPQKNFDDFIEDVILPIPKVENRIVIGHTRSSTRGVNSLENTHPFLINDRLIFSHNGTISNIDELCRKYELDPKDYEVDSQALGTLLDNEGSSVLKEYKGFAALAYTYPKEENTLYLYHGASKDYEYSPIKEERPLFFIENSQGIFYSSLVDSLLAIRDSEEDFVYELPVNIIHQIIDGKFTSSVIKIDREEANVTKYHTVGKSQGAHSSHCRISKVTPKMTNITAADNNGALVINLTKEYKQLVLKESIPSKLLNRYKFDNKDPFIYVHQGRFWEAPRTLAHGRYYLTEKGGSIKTAVDDIGTNIYYFWNGVILKGLEAHKVLLELSADANSFLNRITYVNYAQEISRYSRYPVCNLGQEAEYFADPYKNAWFYERKRVPSGSSTFKYSGRNYIFDSLGFLVGIKSSHNEETLFNTVAAAEMELNVFLKGGIISIPGGNTDTFQESPFREDNPRSKSIIVDENGNQYENSEFAEEDKDINFFYEVIVENPEEFAELYLGNAEETALYEFMDSTLEACRPLESDYVEIQKEIQDLILKAFSFKTTILECLEDDDQRNSLIDIYEAVMSRPTDVDETEDVFDNSIITPKALNLIEEMTTLVEEIKTETQDWEKLSVIKYNEDLSLMLDDIDKKNNNSMEVAHIGRELLKKIEGMDELADQLQANEENEYGQQIAFVVYNGIESLLRNLEDMSIKFKDNVLKEEVIKFKNRKPVIV